MRLISPQDYARYHHFPLDEYQFAGNAHWMFMYIKVNDNLKMHEMAMANINPGAQLPFLIAEPSHHEIKKGKESKCHCHVLTIYNITNINLTSAQRNLKLDHDRLGHILMVAVQRLYQPAKKDTKDFDGVDISSDPCLLAKEPAQLHCDLP